ncbi:MAG TPA: 3-hydroxyacyl-CoA dehydrogenase NAD-binding domain-containing protein, partial [Anaeromyxobacteraceae bacterium]|nr:3-hydroxyacyl-CoA dehydrogenase NAD-binding domain-containing protein [Anaeromyxobacteraceae bacterium]
GAALRSGIMDSLDRALADGDAKAIVITGNERAFSGGADVKEFGTPNSLREPRLAAVIAALESSPKPVVAAIAGVCMGGGLELALGAHYRVAKADAQIALPEVKLGLLPGAGGTQRLPRLVGYGEALGIVLAGKSVKARKALKLGLVDEAVPPPLLRQVAVDRARALASGELKARRGGHAAAGLARVQQALLEENPLGRRVLFSQARRQLLKKTRGQYPGPERALEVIQHGAERGFQAGLALEAKRFGELAVSDVSRRLVEIFFASTALKKDSGVDDASVKPRPVERVGVLGGGLMGSGIAYVTVNAGLPVRLREKDDAAGARALAAVGAILDERVKRRSIDRLERLATARLLTTTTGWEGLGAVDLVVEAVFEDLALKRELLAAFEAVNPRGVFATNTSSIPIADIARGARRPEAVIGMHYFSPVHKMPLLEIIPSAATAPEVIATAVALGKRQGKTVIRVGDAPGFYVNRILGPYMAEGAWLLTEGATIEDLDAALVAYGFPVGPIALLDEVGIDVGEKVGKILQAGFGDRMRAPDALPAVVKAGRLGRKSGKGFYLYEDGKRRGVDATVYGLLPGRGSRAVPREEIAERMALALCNEAARALGDGVVRSARDADIGAVFGIGFPPFRGGPLRALDAMGAKAALDALSRLRDRHGERFEPAPMLVDLARTGGRFHP